MTTGQRIEAGAVPLYSVVSIPRDLRGGGGVTVAADEEPRSDEKAESVDERLARLELRLVRITEERLRLVEEKVDLIEEALDLLRGASESG